MHSLFLRFFLSFWLIIGIIIGAAATGGFWYAEKVQEAIEHFELDDRLLAASSALESGGRAGLTKWLRDFPETRGITLYVIDDQGNDLLDRPLSTRISGTVRRHREFQRSRPSGRDDPRNLRRSRHLPQLIAANGNSFTFFVSTSRIRDAIWGATDVRLLLLIFALLVSGAVSYALASAIARPVRKLRSATVTLADGDLDVRVANSIGNRRDELGMLGRDFDTMATNLQRAAQQQTELSRNISHELRSPLARMRVAVELARRKAGELSEFARLDDEAERLDELIGQILSYTKLDALPQKGNVKIDVAEVVAEVAENVNFECRSDSARGVSVHTSASSAISIPGHYEVLVSAVENVVRNAVRHSAPGSQVTISVDAETHNVRIEICDAGPGVQPEEIPRLFEPFFRTRESAEADGNGGTGLGLAIARRAVELHNGEITARNREEGGLCVVIKLPRH
ncbi:MAG: HAMP domain-containing sensor histidine kinase [Woeseiaceae bacterium]